MTSISAFAAVVYFFVSLQVSYSWVTLMDVPVAENNSVMEVRSLLIRCPNSPVIANPDKKFMPPSRTFDIIKFFDIDKDEPHHYNRVVHCKRKLVISIQFYNAGKRTEKDEVILVRRVYDPVVHQFCGLLKPVIIKLKQKQMRQAYQLNYVREVNGKPYEDVMSKLDTNFTGCVYTTKHPTCGLSYKGGVYIPYSEGFCCSCDVYENVKRQPETFKSRSRTPEPYLRDIRVYPDVNHPLRNPESDPDGVASEEGSLNSKCKCNKVIKRGDHSTDVLRKKKDVRDGKTMFQEDDCPVPWYEKSHIRVKRQYTTNGRQIRGGQSCVDHFVPTYANPVTYHDSAHCLRYSDLWYKIYSLSPPFVERRIGFQVFEKFSKQSGYSFWKRKLSPKGALVGSLNMEHYNLERTISFKYIPLSDLNETFVSLNYTNGFVLVPRGKSKNYPQISGDPLEFMLVSPDQITEDGTVCDKIGLSHHAFYHQANRCARPKGTCLANQPFDLWTHDMHARKHSKKGSYFLENFSKDPIIHRKTSDKINDTYFTLDYDGPYKDALEIEINADTNYALRLGSSAQISEIHIDCTAEEITNITIIVLNRGLISSRYRTKLTNCPEGIPTPWSSTIGPLVNIAPQKVHLFRVSLLGPRPINRFYCTVEVQNSMGEIVARRRFKFQHLDRCICMWHCLCTCLASSKGLKCYPMSIEHYHAAGFLGDLPFKMEPVEYSEFNSRYQGVLIVFSTVLGQLLILGVIKGLIGVCYPPISSLWLWISLPYSGLNLKCYYETCLKDVKIVRNQYGFPINPFNNSRNIQLTTRGLEFLVNCVFFLMLPGVLLLHAVGHVLAIVEDALNLFPKSEEVGGLMDIYENEEEPTDPAEYEAHDSSDHMSKSNISISQTDAISSLIQPEASESVGSTTSSPKELESSQ